MFYFFLNKRPEFVQLNPSWCDLLYRMVVESLGMFPEQAIVTGNGITMTTGHSRNTAHRGLLSGMPADELNLSSIQSGAIEGGILCLNKVSSAVLTEILLISCKIRSILTKSFPSPIRKNWHAEFWQAIEVILRGRGVNKIMQTPPYN